jgi:hypothetical protein
MCVGDINELMKNAKLERLALSVDLALDVEQNTPGRLQRSLISKYVQLQAVPRCLRSLLRLRKSVTPLRSNTSFSRLEHLLESATKHGSHNTKLMKQEITRHVAAEIGQLRKDIASERELIRRELDSYHLVIVAAVRDSIQALKTDIAACQHHTHHNKDIVRELRRAMSDSRTL